MKFKPLQKGETRTGGKLTITDEDGPVATGDICVDGDGTLVVREMEAQDPE